MRIVLTVFLLLLFFRGPVHNQAVTAPRITVNFKVPKDWRKVNDSVYVLTDYEEKSLAESTYLSEGHMPWRLDPKNIAVTCLWDFGITDSTTVFKLAKRLTEVKTNEIYSLTVDSIGYRIHVQTKRHIPLAYKFEVNRRRS